MNLKKWIHLFCFHFCLWHLPWVPAGNQSSHLPSLKHPAFSMSLDFYAWCFEISAINSCMANCFYENVASVGYYLLGELSCWPPSQRYDSSHCYNYFTFSHRTLLFLSSVFYEYNLKYKISRFFTVFLTHFLVSTDLLIHGKWLIKKWTLICC